MATFIHLAIFAATAMALFVGGADAVCSRTVWDGRRWRQFARCVDLGTQGAKLAFTYNAGEVETAFTGQLAAAGGWVGWGVNTGGGWGMAGSSALVAFRAANGSTVLPFMLSPAAISSRHLSCTPINLSIRPGSLSVYISAAGAVSIFASIQRLPSSLNVIWNRGPSVVAFSPQPHSFQPDDLRGYTALDLLSTA